MSVELRKVADAVDGILTFNKEFELIAAASAGREYNVPAGALTLESIGSRYSTTPRNRKLPPGRIP